MNRAFLRALLASLCVTFCMAVTAQSFPAKPVRFIVPFAPGGQSDVVARTVGQKLSERWGQPVVIENKAGAATTIGADFVATPPPRRRSRGRRGRVRLEVAVSFY